MDNIGQLLKDTESSNNQIRQTAEQLLLESRNQDPGFFALRCSEEFKNPQLSDLLRPKAGVLIKYTLLLGAPGLWGSFIPDVKQQIKANVLEASSNCNNDVIRNVAGDLVAIIYFTESSWNGWPTLFPTLIQNMTSQDDNLKKSSLAVLNKICDQAKYQRISLTQDIISLVLDTLIHFFREKIIDDNVEILVLSTLDSGLTFFREIFNTQSGIRNEVLKFLLNSTRSKNQRISASAMLCLKQFITVSSPCLKECWQHIWEATSIQISENASEVAIPAIEIWQSVAQQDKQRIPQDQILQEVSPCLVPALFEILLDEQKSQDDEEMGGQDGEPTIFASARACLTSLAQAMNETFYESAVEFIQNYLWSEEIIQKRAGLIVYSCLMDGTKPQPWAALISKALPTIADIIFHSDNSTLKQEASLALQKTAEFIPEVFFQGNLIDSMFQDLIAAIKAPSRIAVNIAKFWQNFGQFCAKNDNGYSLDFKAAIENLIENAFEIKHIEDYPVIEQSLIAAGTLISCFSKQEVKVGYINSLLEKIKEQKFDNQRIHLIQAGLLSCIKVIVEKCQLSSEDPLVNDVFKLVGQVSEAQGQIPAGGLQALEGLISALGPESTATLFEKIWLWIMKGFDDPKGFIAYLKVIFKMAQACPAQVKNALGDIFKGLETVISHFGYEDDVKAEIFRFVGDLAGVFKGEILMYIENITQVYNAGMELMTCNPVQGGAVGAAELKEGLVKSYRTFFKVVTESENPDLILESVPKMMQYLMITCSKSWDPSVDYIREALGLVFDIVFKFKDQGTENVNSEVVVSSIEKLSQFPEDPRNTEVIDSAKKVFQSF